MSQKGGKRAYRSRLRKNQSACKSCHSMFSFRRDHVRLRSSPRRNATLSRHGAVRISSRCMRWVPRDVAALGRSGQPLEQPASASWSVTKLSQPPADDCDWRRDLPRLQRRVPRATPTELACLAGIAAPTASGHLLKLGRGAVGQRGRARASRCYRIASRRSRAGSSNHPCDGRASIPRRAGLGPVAIISQENSASPSRTRSSRSSFRTKAQRSPQ